MVYSTYLRSFASWLPIVVLCSLPSCVSEETRDRDFHTSGSREADQRAEQRVAKVEQLRGNGEGTKDDAPRSLYERLGGETGISVIVDDFVNRAIADPRANWERKGVKRGGFLGIGAKPAEWQATEENLARLKLHLRQFLAVASGGPSRYEGRDIAELHRGMSITNAEFDATIGSFKASLDALGVVTETQKEILAILESTRPQIAEER